MLEKKNVHSASVVVGGNSESIGGRSSVGLEGLLKCHFELRRAGSDIVANLAWFLMLHGVPKLGVHRDTVVDVQLKLAQHNGDEAENSQSS